MSPAVYVGVDGGGTRAEALVTDAHGRELARRAGPPGLVDPREPAVAAAAVAGLVRGALADAGADSAVALCCGLAGAGRARERDAVRVTLGFEHVADRVIVVGDAEAAMADAFPEGAGVLIVAGTGSIAWARDAEGGTHRTGGWGQQLGDEGSAWSIAMGGLRAIVRAADGRAPATDLAPLILERLGLRAADDLVAWVASATKADVAALAPHVLACAARGDAVATALRDRAVQELVELAEAAILHTGVTAPAVALSGGLIAPGGPLRPLLADAISRAAPGAMLLQRAVDAAAGAARLARRA